MKFSRNDIQRMATEKAIGILMEDKELVLNNASCGWNNGTCLVSLANDADINRATKRIYIVLENEGSWTEHKVNLCVYKEMNKETKLIKTLAKFYGVSSKGEIIYLTKEDDYNKHQQRQMNKYNEKDKRYNVEMNTELNIKLKNRIESEIGKKIKKQDFLVRKHNKVYVINYKYRNIKKTLFI
jgi:hypothetical protein